MPADLKKMLAQVRGSFILIRHYWRAYDRLSHPHRGVIVKPARPARTHRPVQSNCNLIRSDLSPLDNASSRASNDDRFRGNQRPPQSSWGNLGPQGHPHLYRARRAAMTTEIRCRHVQAPRRGSKKRACTCGPEQLDTLPFGPAQFVGAPYYECCCLA